MDRWVAGLCHYHQNSQNKRVLEDMLKEIQLCSEEWQSEAASIRQKLDGWVAEAEVQVGIHRLLERQSTLLGTLEMQRKQLNGVSEQVQRESSHSRPHPSTQDTPSPHQSSGAKTGRPSPTQSGGFGGGSSTTTGSIGGSGRSKTTESF